MNTSASKTPENEKERDNANTKHSVQFSSVSGQSKVKSRTLYLDLAAKVISAFHSEY